LKSERLVFVEGDAALPGLGLQEEIYNEVRLVGPFKYPRS